MRAAIRLLSLALPLLAAAWLLAASAEAGAVYTRSVELSGGERAAVFPLPTTAGDTWTLRIDGTDRAVSLEVLDPRSGAPAARTAFGLGGMRWTAPQTGVWSVRASIAGSAKPLTLTLMAQRQVDGDGHPSRPTTVSLSGANPATAQGAINWAGDADWFAVGMSARNSYTIYTMLGTLNATRGDILLPGDDAPTPLPLHQNGKTLFRTVSPETDGAALIRIAGLGEGVGSYVLGVTPRGDAPHPPVQTAPTPAREDQLRGARAAAEPGELVFELRGEWGAFDASRRVGVWLDTNADGRWDVALITRDGWEVRRWSVAERRWSAGATQVGSRGFDSLILRTSARGFGERVRWQAAAHHPQRGWQPGAAGVLEPQPPIPRSGANWSVLSQLVAPPADRAAVLRALGVGAQLEGQPVVVLDPGHGGQQLGASKYGLIESHSNWTITQSVREQLEAAGVHVVLTREGDTPASLNFSGQLGRPDLHARIETAHLAQADLFVSIHSNGAPDPRAAGLQAWYFPAFAGNRLNVELSRWMLDAMDARLRRLGYDQPSQLVDASCWTKLLGHCDPLYVLAPFLLVDHAAALAWDADPQAMELSGDPWAAPRPPDYPTNWRFTQGLPPIELADPQHWTGPASVFRGTMMPAVLLELLFISNKTDAALLRSPAGRDALAHGIAEGIITWLRREGRLP